MPDIMCHCIKMLQHKAGRETGGKFVLDKRPTRLTERKLCARIVSRNVAAVVPANDGFVSSSMDLRHDNTGMAPVFELFGTRVAPQRSGRGMLRRSPT